MDRNKYEPVVDRTIHKKKRGRPEKVKEIEQLYEVNGRQKIKRYCVCEYSDGVVEQELIETLVR